MLSDPISLTMRRTELVPMSNMGFNLKPGTYQVQGSIYIDPGAPRSNVCKVMVK
jgi:hypothetical protein